LKDIGHGQKGTYPMKRRDFSLQLAHSALAMPLVLSSAHQAVWAQGKPAEGVDFVRLATPLSPSTAAGKIEVLEFFWYGCPHCNDFEPFLESWSQKLPADVVLKRVPASFRDEPFGTHARIYFALEVLGKLNPVHRKVFYAIHTEKSRLEKTPEIAAFATKAGLDSAKFMEAFNSFSVQTKARQAKRLAEDYRIDGVPALGVHGRYYTSPSLAGGAQQALKVLDFLIQQVRQKS
jgi:protein dithiol oxidoreductase (disulfide-forming)